VRPLRALAPLLLALLTWQAGWGASVATCQMVPVPTGRAAAAPASPHHDHHQHQSHTPHPAPASPETQAPPCPLPGGCAATGPVPDTPAAVTVVEAEVGVDTPREPQRTPAAPVRTPEPPPPRPAAHP
jgi:hypothetical protein